MSPIRRHVKESCIGKRRYANFKAAKLAAKRSTAKRPYQCDLCSGVHLTKTPRNGHI